LKSSPRPLFTYGSTRFIFLIGDRAIKVVRIRPLHAAAVILHVLFSRKRRNRFVRKHAASSYGSAWREFWDGFYVNRNEYWYYQRSKDPRVMPTERQLLGGWIIIQRRGEPVEEADLAELQDWTLSFYLEAEELEGEEEWPEMGKPWQFCRHPDDGHIVLVDYGRAATLAALIKTAGVNSIK
jgi:hypothetical protein